MECEQSGVIYDQKLVEPVWGLQLPFSPDSEDGKWSQSEGVGKATASCNAGQKRTSVGVGLSVSSELTS